jgi:hypothetical protein
LTDVDRLHWQVPGGCAFPDGGVCTVPPPRYLPHGWGDVVAPGGGGCRLDDIIFAATVTARGRGLPGRKERMKGKVGRLWTFPGSR